MSLQRTYIRFLSTPKASALSKDTVALHYITSGISVSGEAIISHLSNQHHVLEMKTEKVLSGFETTDSLVLEIETVVEFKSGGGAYLPGLDDNFLADQTATFLLIHVVNFQNGLINQIRQYWDQGTLLKQMGVIGKTGRNWPIKDGKDQCKLVQSSVANVPPSSAVSHTRDRGISNASNGSTASSIRPTPDPHSTLSLFAPREQEQVAEIKPAVIPPRNSAKPPPRDLGDLFISSDGESNGYTEVIPPKAPAKFSPGHNYDFLDDDSHENPPDNSGRGVKPDPKKYNHFEMSDQYPDPRKAARVGGNSGNKASWDFESFSTPENSAQGPHRQQSKVEQLGGGSRTIYKTSGDGMGGRKVVEEEPPARAPRGISAAKRAEMGYEDEDTNQGSGKAELLGGGSRTIYRTQGDGMGGRKSVAEEAPARGPRTTSAAKRAEMTYEEEEPRNEVEQLAGGNRTIYRTQGDGMGGRKNATEEEGTQRRAPRTLSAAKQAEMGYADDEPVSNPLDQLGGGNRTIYRTQGDGMGGRKVVAAEQASANAPRALSAAKRAEMTYDEEEEPSGKVELLGGGSRTIYKTTGDGMGGRKGASSSIFGFDEEEPVERNKENQQQRPNVRNNNQPSPFWDF